MNLAIPVYIEEHKLPGEATPQFHLRPLFFAAPAKASRQLSSGMSKLAQAIRRELDGLAKAPRQEGLIPWTFSPALAEHKVKFTLVLRRQTAQCRFLVLAFEAFDRKIAFTPTLPEVYFEVLRGQEVGVRAQEVISEHFRKLEKEEGEGFELPEQLNTYVRAWVTTLELDVHSRPSLERPKELNFLALFSNEKPDGRAELAKVGRCLDWLYPDDLQRAALRETEVAELIELLAEKDKRPVLLVGPAKVGKTTLIHEAVHARVAARQNAYASEENVWLIAPARLISGMSYVGQWEGRLLAIIEHAAKQEHVLYFDDVLGLYQAGRSADSDLNVAAVMRPWIERRDFRMLAEMTPEAFSVLREKDRGMADLFHVVPVREPGEGQSRRILMRVLRGLEDRYLCRFDVDVLPTTMDLQQRYMRDQSMPGKAAGFVAALAGKFREKEITRAVALSEFQARSGLSLAFLDGEARLERAGVIKAIAKEIVGQNAAVEAMADVVSIAKARLNDPGRPLGTFLFLGPTGVGKTAAAKALAKFLYGDEARLVRFDMNEYLDKASPARLIGTFAQPEGLLTAAVRRQPFCVLLLDEIEKAHPAVFDLLLQVLGEGRLTDSLGRTSDFGNAVVIMTSNLGAREAGHSFGLRPAETSKREVYLDAARKFFRPEFFNRIDRIVPFEALDRRQVALIANRLIADLFKREGLVHRRCVLEIDPAAMGRIVEQGYHPELGARALKRAIERQLTGPIAQRLAALRPDAPTIISIFPSGDGIAPQVQPLIQSAAVDTGMGEIDLADVEGTLDRVEDYVNEVAGAQGANAPASLSADALSPGHFRYFAVREQIQRIDRLIQQIDQANAIRRPGKLRRTSRVPQAKRILRLNAEENVAPLLGAGDVHGRLMEMMERAAAVGDAPTDRVMEVLQECALLEAMTGQGATRVLLSFRPPAGRGGATAGDLCKAYSHLFARQYGFSATVIDNLSIFHLLLEMPGAEAILRGEAGCHLFLGAEENVLPIAVAIRPLAAEEDAAKVARLLESAREKWREAVVGGEATLAAAPLPLGEVVRVYDERGATLDLASQLLCPNLPTGEDLRRFIIAALSFPPRLFSGGR